MKNAMIVFYILILFTQSGIATSLRLVRVIRYSLCIIRRILDTNSLTQAMQETYAVIFVVRPALPSAPRLARAPYRHLSKPYKKIICTMLSNRTVTGRTMAHPRTH